MDFSSSSPRLIGETHHLFQQKLDQALKAAGLPLTAEQFKLMSRLWEEDGRSQQQLAELVGRNRSVLGKMIDVLEKKELLRREGDPRDKRINRVFLTPKGKKLKGPTRKIALQTIHEGLKGLSDPEIDLLRNLLLRIRENLS